MANVDLNVMVHVFLGLQMSGALTYVLITPVAFFHTAITRHPVWFSFAISWIVFGCSYSFLLLSGQQYAEVPEKTVCTVQTGLVYSVPYLVVSTSLGLVLHLLLNVISALSRRSMKIKTFPITMTLLVVAPWVIWGVVLTAVMIFAFSRPEQIVLSPNRTYCIILDTVLPRVTAVYVAVLASTILFAEAVIAALLHRNGAIPGMLKRDLTMSIRILIFTLLGGATFAVALVFSVTRIRGVEFDLVIAALPPTSAIIFGTQSDILSRLWCCGRADDTEATDSGVSLTTVRSVHPEQASYALAVPIFSGSSRPEHSFRSDRGTISSKEPDDGMESVALSMSIPATPISPYSPTSSNRTPKTPTRMHDPASPNTTPPKSPYSASPSFLQL